VHKVFGEFDLVVRGIGEFEEVFVSGQVHEGEFISFRGFFFLAEFEAYFFVEFDGGRGIGDADAGVEKLDHGREFGGKLLACEVWSCGGGWEALEIPRLEVF